MTSTRSCDQRRSRGHVGIVGCGTAGPALGTFLARDGWRVTLIERAADLRPIGAGILLQPTGMHVLDRLGLLKGEGQVLACGEVVRRLRGGTLSGRSVLDLAYEDLDRPGSPCFGLGVQRGMLQRHLLDAARGAHVEIRTGIEVAAIDQPAASIVDTHGSRHGPFDLIAVCDGARAGIASSMGIVRRSARYPFGALWYIADTPDNHPFTGTLSQVYHGTGTLLGFLPSGRLAPGEPARVSLFWSLRLREERRMRDEGVRSFRDRVVSLDPRAATLLEGLSSMDQVVTAAYHDTVLHAPVAPGSDPRVVFLGDAAHAMSPQLGQGANLALLDAMTLAESLRQAESIGQALLRYARARKNPTRYYHAASRWLTPVFQSDHEWIAPLRDRLFGRLGRLPWVRRQMLLALAGVKTGIWTADPIPPF